MSKAFSGVFLSVCLSVCPHDFSKTIDLKVFKFDIEDDHEILYTYYDFGVKR